MRHLLVGLVIGLVAACSPERPGDDGDDGTDLCTGDEDRCVGQTYQTCEGGVFVDAETCGGATSICSSNLDGCVACDPAQGTIACSGDTAYNCNPDGSLGTSIETCVAGEECMPGVGCTRACTADGVDLIYVVDDAYNLHSFDPRLIGTGTEYQLIGALACNPTMGNVPGWAGIGVTPFSMAVDRMARAWVLYTSGEIFHVDTQNAQCSATGYVGRQGPMLLFGMAFRTDGPMADTEKLYLAGGNPDAQQGSGNLAVVDPNSYMQTLVGPIGPQGDFSAELTGTGAAELFGFWPGDTAFVQQIDVATGQGAGTPFNVGSLGIAEAWAFAQWGGAFYLFITSGGSSNVVKVDKTSGMVTTPLMNTGHRVVGAGVSTCAPTQVE
jgi:hypothetical protein